MLTLIIGAYYHWNDGIAVDLSFMYIFNILWGIHQCVYSTDDRCIQ